ncbi:Protein CBR-VALV-1 [Aphelenchoides besseyi]|nr:Protein CBR-VALV-1 [Aphelenchoides besseyi]
MTAICPNCDKPVYFAERVFSIGKDWHKTCFRCNNPHCNKILSVGNHSEHDGHPFCHRCYAAMFMPSSYGRGGVESHVFLNGTTGKV